MHTMMSVLILLPVLLIGVLVPWLAWSRRGIMFGLTVPLDFAETEAGRGALLRYRRDSATLAVVVTAVLAVLLAKGEMAVYAAAASVAIPVEMIGTWLLWRRGARSIATYAVVVPLERKADLAAMGQGSQQMTALMATAAAVIPLGVEAVWLRAQWARIPERWVQHWNAAGVANGWAHKSEGGVYGPLVTGVVMVVLMLGINLMLGKASGVNVTMRRRAMLPTAALAWLLAGMFCLIGLLPVRQGITPQTIVAATIGMVVATFAVVGWMVWRGGMAPNQAAEPYDSTPDAGWHAGLFYYNPADAAVVVPKRFGVGWTLNMARPLAWLYLGGVLLLAVGSLLVPRLLK